MVAKPEKNRCWDEKFVRQDHVLGSQMLNEYVMLAPQQGAYYGLNKTGKQVWELLRHPVTVAEIISEFQQHKEPNGAKKLPVEIADFVQDLLGEKLIVRIAAAEMMSRPDPV